MGSFNGGDWGEPLNSAIVAGAQHLQRNTWGANSWGR
jgi:hypothetical protein